MRPSISAEETFAALARISPEEALNDALMAMQDEAEVHRTVLPYRSWDMLGLIGKEHAHTLLRQSVRYCLHVGMRDRISRREQRAIRVCDERDLRELEVRPHGLEVDHLLCGIQMRGVARQCRAAGATLSAAACSASLNDDAAMPAAVRSS